MPRAGLSPAVLLDAAAELANSGGIDAVTLAAVARRFDVAVPSIYKHVDGLPALLDALTERGATALAGALQSADDIASMARAYRGFATSAPGLYAAAQLPPRSDSTRRAQAMATDPVIGLLRTQGVDDADLLDAARFLRSALHGFVDTERVGGFAHPRAVDASFAALIAAVERAIGTWPSPSTAAPGSFTRPQ